MPNHTIGIFWRNFEENPKKLWQHFSSLRQECAHEPTHGVQAIPVSTDVKPRTIPRQNSTLSMMCPVFMLKQIQQAARHESDERGCTEIPEHRCCFLISRLCFVDRIDCRLFCANALASIKTSIKLRQLRPLWLFARCGCDLHECCTGIFTPSKLWSQKKKKSQGIKCLPHLSFLSSPFFTPSQSNAYWLSGIKMSHTTMSLAVCVCNGFALQLHTSCVGHGALWSWLALRRVLSVFSGPSGGS